MNKHIIIDARIRRSSTGRYTDRLLEHLQTIDKSNRYTVLVEPDDKWKPKSRNFVAIPTKYPQFSFNPFHQLGFSRQLRKLKPDLVHFTMTQQPLCYVGNIVTTTHDLTMLRYIRAGTTSELVFWLKKVGYRFLMWAAHRKSKRIIVPTNFVAKDLAKHHTFTMPKIRVTLEASEPPIPGKSEPPSAVHSSQSKVDNFLLYVGSAFPHKNLERLLAAFEILHKSKPDLKLVLAGKKEFYYKELEETAKKLPHPKHIIFPGYVSDAELKWLYENARAYVFPSMSEGFGLPGLEAMVHGCPVVSSNATSLPEVYGDAAIYFDPSNTQDMAQKISSVLDDKKLRANLIKNGYKQAQQFSWKRMAQETYDVYGELL
jgi:glycosyltransferase involved in cell wall biosynthesis